MEPYQYLPLQQDLQEIRIFRYAADISDLTLAVEMMTTSLMQPDHQAFTTLSYVWGDPAMTFPIIVNGKRLSVTKSVHELLEILFRSKELDGPLSTGSIQESWWWMDSICINQQDLIERASQVRFMGEIYKTSSLTIAYTGPSFDDSDLAMTWIRRTTNPSNRPLENSEAHKLVGAFWKFHTRPWFSRAWILQEWVLPKRVMFLTGTTMVDSETLEKTILTSRLGISSNLRRQLNLRRVFQANSFAPFFRTLIAMSRLNAVDSRDVIYATSGMIRDAIHIIPYPDYTASLTQIYGSVVYLYAQKYGRLDLLCLNQWQKARADLPSWIPDLHTTAHLQTHTMVADNMNVLESVVLSTSQTSDVDTLVTSSATLYNERGQVQSNVFSRDVNIDGVIIRYSGTQWGYWADGGSIARVSITRDFRVLTVSAIWISNVASLGGHLVYENTKEEWDKRWVKEKLRKELPLEQPSTLPYRFSSDDEFRKAFVRTIGLCPCSPKRCSRQTCFCQWDPSIEFHQCDDLETEVIKNFAQQATDSNRSDEEPKSEVKQEAKLQAEWWSMNKEFRLGNTSLEQLFLTAPPVSSPIQPRDSMARFRLVVSKMNRRLMADAWGGLGMVPHEARLGDRICVIIGCSIPLLLRKSGDCWKVVGEVYLYGAFMRGRATGLAQEGHVKVERISLC
ncbi:heterokaryon incompatibility protein-domain-containing protein [Paraphoma chrysanthemicola]|uniref:Heterokaryon incompatibility protein-domain-containing protein n=1 Tax=Paraphoma chrysanthemicola TaxID=798071 RepID=A0A8K0QTI1_9PLEO|nr:heterokaryon incompatibility protein-domain-containing protein [Paraphoma chrysanthemicola]